MPISDDNTLMDLITETKGDLRCYSHGAMNVHMPSGEILMTPQGDKTKNIQNLISMINNYKKENETSSDK